MHILVIGGTGFLGRGFAEDAVALGHEVTVVDRRPPLAWRLAERIKIHVADVTRRRRATSNTRPMPLRTSILPVNRTYDFSSLAR